MSKNTDENVVDRYVKRAYFNYTQPGSLSSLHNFVKQRGIKGIKQAQKSLNKIQTFNLFRLPKRKTYRPFIVRSQNQVVQLDLIDWQLLKRHNSNFAYLLVGIDSFTKFAYAYPLKRKTGKDVAEALAKLIKSVKVPIQSVYHDAGLEFKNSIVSDLLAKHKIRSMTPFTIRKASHAERLILTLKRKIYKLFHHNGNKRWLDIYEGVVKAYNNSIHSAHGFKPSAIRKKDEDEVFHQLYIKLVHNKLRDPVFKPTQLVRISNKRLTFTRGYHINFSTEVFRIRSIHTTYPIPSYKLEDLEGNVLQGSYTEGDLIAATSESQQND